MKEEKNCPGCGVKLTFMTTPNLGGGKLKDGGRVCRKCFAKMISLDTGFGLNSKEKYTSEDIKKSIANDASKDQQIKTQIQNLGGFDKFLARKEINELPNILRDDEKIVYLINGFYNNRNVVITATDKRLLFIDKGLIYGLKVTEFPYNQITSINYETEMIFGKILISTHSQAIYIEKVEKDEAKNFTSRISQILSDAVNIQSPSERQTIQNHPDPITQLEKLASLKEKGLITDEEFQEQKKKLLSQ